MIERSQALAALSQDEFDVVVVGGGITGAGVALDAATRGYSVALLERADFASGTSSRSSKLVHGGLRYLQNFDLGLVREALLERQLMVTLAPHLVRPLPLVVPAFEGARPDRLVGVGLNLYDVMSVDRDRLRSRRVARPRRTRSPAGLRRPVARGPSGREEGESWSPERHRVISGEEVLELLPALAAREPTSGYLFYDCQTDDVRLVLTVLGEAERFGAVCANRLDVTGLLERDGRARGVRVARRRERRAVRGARRERGQRDRRVGRRAAPAGAPRRGRAAAHPAEPRHPHHASPRRPAARRRRDRPGRRGPLDLRAAVARAHAGRARPTTTTRARSTTSGPRPRTSTTCWRPSTPSSDTTLGPAELTGAFAGVRPLISTGDPKKSVDISRKAELYETSSGMITITGGKLTTWRRMAKMTVDRLVERDARDAPCRTHEIPLGQAIAVEELPRVEGVPAESYAALASRYGHAAHEVLALAAERGELAQPIVPGLPDLLAEVALAARREQARSIGDVLLRRTRLGLLAARELVPLGRRAGAVERVGGDPRAGARLEPRATRCSSCERFAEEADAEGIARRHGPAAGRDAGRRARAGSPVGAPQRRERPCRVAARGRSRARAGRAARG